jgi:small subunit ribosomal protein S6
METERKAHAMALYEHIFLARQDVSQQQVEDLTAALTEVLSQGGGKVTKNEYWGLKGLSYRIRKNRKAHYTLLNIEAPAAAVAEMERQMRINEDILRFMTVRVDELEEGPSAMMQKRDRDERDGGRGERGAPSGDRRPRRF